MDTQINNKSENGSILADLRSGALPLRELPRFMLWLLGRSFWFWFLLIVLGTFVITR